MPTYRLYSLDRDSGHFTGVNELNAADDAAAIQIVQKIDDEFARELWLGGRMVGCFGPTADQAVDRASPNAGAEQSASA